MAYYTSQQLSGNRHRNAVRVGLGVALEPVADGVDVRVGASVGVGVSVGDSVPARVGRAVGETEGVPTVVVGQIGFDAAGVTPTGARVARGEGDVNPGSCNKNARYPSKDLL